MDNPDRAREILHDMNNALAAAMGAAELIVSEVNSDSQVARDAQDIITSTTTGRDLVLEMRQLLGLG